MIILTKLSDFNFFILKNLQFIKNFQFILRGLKSNLLISTIENL